MSNFRFLLVFLIINTCFASVCPEDKALELGDKYLNLGNDFNAVTEFKRYIYFNKENMDEKLSYAFYRIGIAHRNLNEWALALDALQKSFQTEKNDFMKDEKRISIAITQISCNKISAAKFGLIKLEMYSKYEEIKKMAYFYHGVCSLYEYKWNEAIHTFNNYFNLFPDKSLESKREKIMEILNQASFAKYKSPNLSKWLSTLIPGVGQVYSGDWFDGLNAFAINMPLGYLVINNLVNKQYKDAIFNGLFLFRRFHQGNINNAKKIAEDYNLAINKKMLDSILEVLIDY